MESDFTQLVRGASAELRRLNAAKTNEEAASAARAIQERHLVGLEAEDPIIAAAIQGLMCDMLRTRLGRWRYTA